MKKNPHAFPTRCEDQYDVEGMTLRDYFAAHVAIGIAGKDHLTPEQRAAFAYLEADAMLEAREVR